MADLVVVVVAVAVVGGTISSTPVAPKPKSKPKLRHPHRCQSPTDHRRHRCPGRGRGCRRIERPRPTRGPTPKVHRRWAVAVAAAKKKEAAAPAPVPPRTTMRRRASHPRTGSCSVPATHHRHHRRATDPPRRSHWPRCSQPCRNCRRPPHPHRWPRCWRRTIAIATTDPVVGRGRGRGPSREPGRISVSDVDAAAGGRNSAGTTTGSAQRRRRRRRSWSPGGGTRPRRPGCRRADRPLPPLRQYLQWYWRCSDRPPPPPHGGGHCRHRCPTSALVRRRTPDRSC